MKVCVSAQGETLDAAVDPRFGRCPFLVFVDAESLDCQAVTNPGFESSGGAGISAGQAVVDNAAETLLTGNVGPNAFNVLNAGNVAVYTGATGTVRDAVQALKEAKLTQVNAASVDSHFGMQ